jgi:hypothetical protein
MLEEVQMSLDQHMPYPFNRFCFRSSPRLLIVAVFFLTSITFSWHKRLHKNSIRYDPVPFTGKVMTAKLMAFSICLSSVSALHNAINFIFQIKD